MEENQKVSTKQEYTSYLEKISEKHLFVNINGEPYNLKNENEVSDVVDIVLENEEIKIFIKEVYEKVLNRITDPWISPEAAAFLTKAAENRRRIENDPNNVELQRMNRLINDD
jgi:hypothetical protein